MLLLLEELELRLAGRVSGLTVLWLTGSFALLGGRISVRVVNLVQPKPDIRLLYSFSASVLAAAKVLALQKKYIQ